MSYPQPYPPQHYVPPPRRKSARTPMIWLFVMLALCFGLPLVGVITAVVFSGAEPVRAPDRALPAAAVPDYRIVSNVGGHIVADVDTMPQGDGLRRVFDSIRARSYPDGGYFVSINCSAGGTASADNRLANGKFAVGRLGAGQVGLPEGGHEFSIVPDRECPKLGWTPQPTTIAPATIAGPATSFSDGTYEVGKEIKAGTYTCVADKGWPGYWQRAKNAEGDLDSIIANEIVAEGAQAIVTVKAKEFFKAQALNCRIR